MCRALYNSTFSARSSFDSYLWHDGQELWEVDSAVFVAFLICSFHVHLILSFFKIFFKNVGFLLNSHGNTVISCEKWGAPLNQPRWRECPERSSRAQPRPSSSSSWSSSLSSLWSPWSSRAQPGPFYRHHLHDHIDHPQFLMINMIITCITALGHPGSDQKGWTLLWTLRSARPKTGQSRMSWCQEKETLNNFIKHAPWIMSVFLYKLRCEKAIFIR